MANEYREFIRNYEFCFLSVKHKEFPSRVPFLVFTGKAPAHVTGRILTPDFTQKESLFTYEHLINPAYSSPLIPASGYYNVPSIDNSKQFALYFSLSPDRQYRKSLSNEHYAAISEIPTGSPSGAVAQKSRRMLLSHKQTPDIRPAVAELAYAMTYSKTNTFPSLRQALHSVENSRDYESLAFSRFFAVSLVRNYKFPVLWHKQAKVGFFVKGKLYVLDEIFHLKDFFNKRWATDLFSVRDFK